MKSVIYKYPITDYQGGINLPSLTKIIDCEVHNGIICVWAIHHVDAVSNPFQENPDVFILGAGWEIDNDLLFRYNHLKTIHVGGFVWHVYARKEVM